MPPQASTPQIQATQDQSVPPYMPDDTTNNQKAQDDKMLVEFLQEIDQRLSDLEQRIEAMEQAESNNTTE